MYENLCVSGHRYTDLQTLRDRGGQRSLEGYNPYNHRVAKNGHDLVTRQQKPLTYMYT